MTQRGSRGRQVLGQAPHLVFVWGSRCIPFIVFFQAKRGEAPYSMDANLLHISYEGNALEDPWVAPLESMFTRSVSPEQVMTRRLRFRSDWHIFPFGVQAFAVNR